MPPNTVSWGLMAEGPALSARSLQRRREAYVETLAREARRIADRLYQAGAKQIILFGSAARGDARVGSDLDLAVVWDSERPLADRTVAVYQIVGPTEVPVNLIALAVVSRAVAGIMSPDPRSPDDV